MWGFLWEGICSRSVYLGYWIVMIIGNIDFDSASQFR